MGPFELPETTKDNDLNFLQTRLTISFRDKDYSMQFALPYIKSAGIPSGTLPNPINQDYEIQASTSTPISPPPSKSPTASSSEQTECTPTPLSVSTWRSSSQRHKNKTSDNDKPFNDYLKIKISKQNVNDESSNNNANKMFLLSLLPDLNSTQTPALVHIPNSSRILSSQTSPFVVPEIQHLSKSYSQVTTGIKLPNTDIIEYTTDDGLNEATYIQLLQNSVGEVNYTQN
ncbi:hypothetical protein K1T71_011624 [Dendrolimus kikuchii]|uniref:Uncharacterized protein n=1 Tax=Dendrolimus kikuchii TaxID=765133 RepID=A0ACC1CLN1_9NEOP|nr:hypothetical protein K1T71_011624 [Dendrolimus kikuchii]